MKTPYHKGKVLLGILTYRNGSFIAGRRYCTQIARTARKYNCEVVVFSPRDSDEGSGHVCGFIYNESNKRWKPARTRLPDIVYDRFSNMAPSALQEYAAYRQGSILHYINNRFVHKWNAHNYFQQNEEIKRYLPETVKVEKGRLGHLIAKHDSLYAKPANGSGGKGILRIRRKKEKLELIGRNKNGDIVERVLYSIPAAERYLLRWCQDYDRTFILQQGLSLSLQPGYIYDSRVLVQKNINNEWKLTGIVGKKSPDQLVTSNLQGGGEAVDFHHMLSGRFTPAGIQEITRQVKKLSLLIPPYIEQSFGGFVEFGLDIGIDTQGQVWLIEVNTKPNRELFRLANKRETYKRAIEIPVLYALYQLGRTPL
ncbi:YheC/YheD family endospore coat-associated protein [Aneurinibacillus tyrosinisolvens]|uniref:YheC/YheD family endospore coat-associated protein n=1 Tax=Aneurinibacillus tyrosinisolvens TaxID=1443435 RepID=UPI00063F57BC|nr:YheC/YheD family protein [Aneurinibacillus tyrosinisolvens]